ncbi:olfactory receptor 51E1-like [Amia ocellicauda]|uniref:olfactory receptor 51E1-like n=1 Tax=Amia ocellicauda TaxID=2972642 RepID=UPI003463E51E
MMNSSDTTFILSAYYEIGDTKYFYFTILLLLYIFTVSANLILIVVIYVERSLHEPMYFFLCSLSVNAIYGSTALCPHLLTNILSDHHDISQISCLVQIFCLYTYAQCEFSSLALMGYDRYLSICYPLQYNMIMTPVKVIKLLILSWLYPICIFGILFILTLQLPLCGRIIEKVYCVNYSIVKLSCIDTTINNIYGLITLLLTAVLPVILILYSYLRILRLCLRSSKESQAKALNTCTPHLVTLINFFISSFFEIVQARFDMSYMPSGVRIFLSVYFLIIPPVINPIIYGVRIRNINVRLRKWFVHQTHP